MTQPATEATISSPPKTDIRPDTFDLPTGKSMLADQSMEISCATSTRFIVIAGAADSGKTTLVGSLHERFLRGSWGGFLFAGCSTFLGFEQICHEGRGVSKRVEADTQRTKRSEGRRLFHLRVRLEDCSKPAQDILISDISGEEFDTARDSGEDARELQIVKAAHRLVLLIDGEKISELDKRQAARDEGMLLLRTLCEEGLLGKTSKVDVAFTKWDMVQSSGAAVQATAFADVIEREILAKYGAQIGEIRVFRVAARDHLGVLPPAYGLESALMAWVEDEGQITIAPPKPLAEAKNATEYDRYYRRQLPQHFEDTK